MLIETEELQHQYRPGADHVLQGISESFGAGATALTGRSGSGKSTLLYILALMLTPTSGTVRWDGRDVGRLSDGERSALRAQHVGFVFQDALLDPAQTALENVLEAAWLARMPRQPALESAQTLMRQMGVSARAAHRPGELSGGQAQRIALCRALVKGPSVIFADEPTGNLDSDSSQIVWEALRGAADGGATVILATHDSSLASSCDRVLTVGS